MKPITLKTSTIVCALLFTVGIAAAQAPDFLPRSRWLKQIGASVSDDTTLQSTLARISPEDRVEFTKRALKAAGRLPVSPEERAHAIVRVAIACIAGITGEDRMKVIAEVFAETPSEYLPTLTEELAKRFDQELNGLSDEQHQKIAQDTLKIAIERNAKTDLPTVRNTFVILAFARGSKNPALANNLIAMLPDERMRNLAAGWVRSVMLNNDYEPLLAAADVEALPGPRNVEMTRMVGHSLMDRLLADLSNNTQWELGEGEVRTASGDSVWIPLSQVWQYSGMTSTELHGADYGLNRVPVQPVPTGYQNQGSNIKGQYGEVMWDGKKWVQWNGKKWVTVKSVNLGSCKCPDKSKCTCKIISIKPIK